jgi:pyruvate/2-oxoglutarate dehydrogenase complex dihydrolipoamide dehydrogenase (E3) component
MGGLDCYLEASKQKAGRRSWPISRRIGRSDSFGTSKLVTPNEVEISHPNLTRDRVSGQNIIIATGSRPAFSGAENSKILNSDQMLKNVAIPEHLLIIGGGYIGCEFASVYQTLESK